MGGSSVLFPWSSIALDSHLEFLPWPERHHPARGDRDLLAGLGVAPGPLVLLAQVEIADPGQGVLAGDQGAPAVATAVVLQELPHPVAGSTHVFAPPYRLDGQRLPIRNAPPTLGEGTREVLQQLLQLSEPELQALRDKGVLTLPQI